MHNFTFYVGCLFVLTGCGYRWQPGSFESSCPSITVPFIEGDEDGLLTNEVVRALASSGIADIRFHGGDYRLNISILREGKEILGFRKDRQKVNGKTKRNMFACEARKILSVEATLFRGDSDEVAFGPYVLEADADFDYVDGDSYQDLMFVDLQGTSQAVLPFSLGQLEPYEAALDASMRLLYSRLAQKIVDVISSQYRG